MRQAFAGIFVGAIAVTAAWAQSPPSTTEPGIYAEIEGATTMISSTVVDKASPGGVMSNAASFGFKGIDIKATIAGSKSTMRLTAAKHSEFVFRGDSFKPNEYALVKLETKDDRRELKTGKVGMFGRTKSEVDKDAMVKVTFTKVEENLWKVAPAGALQPGEYAFVLSTALPERVWSFGVE